MDDGVARDDDCQKITFYIMPCGPLHNTLSM